MYPAQRTLRTTQAGVYTLMSWEHRWLTGPAFLLQPEENWPVRHVPLEPDTNDVEIKDSPFKLIASIAATNNEERVVDRILNRTNHSWFAVRILARVRRWLYNHRNLKRSDTGDKIQSRTEWIRPEESKEKMRVFVKSAQEKAFAVEIGCLSAGRPIPINSRLKFLELFIDEHGILRVGGRIKRGPFALDQKHPTILYDSWLTELIIAEMHINLAHSAPERTLAEFRMLYWAIGVRRLAV